MLAPAFLAGDVHCAEEQAWNRAQLAVPVERPAVRLWTYAAPGIVLGRAQTALSVAMRPVMKSSYAPVGLPSFKRTRTTL